MPTNTFLGTGLMGTGFIRRARANGLTVRAWAMLNQTLPSVRHLALLLAACLAWPARLLAFELPVHESVTRAAFKPGIDVSPEVLNTIVQANHDSDYHQDSPHRHFDNADGPATVCVHWLTGVNRWFDEIVELATPLIPERSKLMAPQEARERIGMIAHAVQDFFSHSNYIELGLPPPSPGFLLSACNPPSLDPRLQTGYFSSAWAVGGGAARAAAEGPGASTRHLGCPPLGPPAPFRQCHSRLNKDNPTRPNHATATAYAQIVTHSILEEIRRRALAKFGADDTIDVECLMMKLLWRDDEKRTCHRKWVVEGTVVTSVNPEAVGYPSGQLALRNVKLRVHWEPKRYVPPPERVEAVVWIEPEALGPIEVALSWPKNCQRTSIEWSANDDLRRAKLRMTPEERPIELLSTGITLDLPDEMNIPCRPPFTWYDFSYVCVLGGATMPLASSESLDVPFRCAGDRRHVTGNRFTGTMRPDR